MILPSFQTLFELTGDKRNSEAQATVTEALGQNAMNGSVQSECFPFSIPKYWDSFPIGYCFLCGIETWGLTLSVIATQHAKTTLTHLRITNQYSWDGSVWNRGQACGALRSARIYAWAKKVGFLDAAKNLHRYSLVRLLGGGVSDWGFGVPRLTHRSTSAAMVYTFGLLEMYDHCENLLEKAEWLHVVAWVVGSTLVLFLFSQPGFLAGGYGAVLGGTTIGYRGNAPRRWVDYRLVNPDHSFLVQAGNKSLDLGLLGRLSEIVMYKFSHVSFLINYTLPLLAM
ncbi:hypothetical protein HOY82DRAFT_535471 [Tuber indicum]|nr:hypothetical protein HOY82DRAFT_535471 [Tuber indicum]